MARCARRGRPRATEENHGQCRNLTLVLALLVAFAAVPAGAQAAAPPGPRAPSAPEILAAFTKASTGNVADAVDEATGVRASCRRT